MKSEIIIFCILLLLIFNFFNDLLDYNQLKSFFQPTAVILLLSNNKTHIENL